MTDTTARQTFNHAPGSSSYQKIRRIYDLAAQRDLDWADPANLEALADVAFIADSKAFGPEPSAMPISKVRASWLEHAERLRTVQLPEMRALVEGPPTEWP